MEGLIGSLRGLPAIVCGNAHGVFEDLHEALMLCKNPIIFAVNDVGMYLPHVDHWVSLHADKLSAWGEVRKLHRGGEDIKFHSPILWPSVHYAWEGLTPSSFHLSGYFAMQIAWIMGAEPIVLCGCPGESKRRFVEVETRNNFDYARVGVRESVEREMERLPEFKKAVRSMSGWTREYFGAP